jgi:hypothetical protein
VRDALLRLQRSAGNRAVARLVALQRYKTRTVGYSDATEAAPVRARRLTDRLNVFHANLAYLTVGGAGGDVVASVGSGQEGHAERIAIGGWLLGNGNPFPGLRETPAWLRSFRDIGARGERSAATLYTELSPCYSGTDPCTRALPGMLQDSDEVVHSFDSKEQAQTAITTMFAHPAAPVPAPVPDLELSDAEEHEDEDADVPLLDLTPQAQVPIPPLPAPVLGNAPPLPPPVLGPPRRPGLVLSGAQFRPQPGPPAFKVKKQPFKPKTHKPRAICSVCGENTALKKNRTVYAHKRGRTVCPGSGQPPFGATPRFGPLF